MAGLRRWRGRGSRRWPPAGHDRVRRTGAGLRRARGHRKGRGGGRDTRVCRRWRGRASGSWVVVG